MTTIKPITKHQALEWTNTMNLFLICIRSDLAELENPTVLPTEQIGIHHWAQKFYNCYKTLIICNGFEKLPEHYENELLFEGYLAGLPP
jgi:hypothetical protein